MADLCQNGQIVPVIIPVDLAGGANAGDWVKVTDYNHFEFVIIADAGTAGQDLVVTIEQATSNSGAGNVALDFQRVYQKIGATALNAVGTFTLVEGSDIPRSSSAENTYLNLTTGENEQLIVIPFDAQDLTDGFTHVQCSIADTGTTAGKLGTVLCILTESRYAQKTTPSAIA